MINLPSLMKLIFYLIQCAIFISLIFVGEPSGANSFSNFDTLLQCNFIQLNPDQPPSSFTQPHIAGSLFIAIPALVLWVIALFLVSLFHQIRSVLSGPHLVEIPR